MTHEELLDKRIQNTRNHSGLQFARATEWVREAWELHPLSVKISAQQAFFLGRLKGSTGRRLGLSDEEVSGIMDWVSAKSSLWGVEPMTIYSYLKTDENVARDLVHSSRPTLDQAMGFSSVAQSTLTKIGREIGGRHEVQRALVAIINRERLGASGVSGILSDIKGMDDESALEYLATVDYAAYKERLANREVYAYGEQDIVRLGKVRESKRVKPLSDMASLTDMHVELLLDEGGYEVGKMMVVAAELGEIASAILATKAKIDQALGTAALDTTVLMAESKARDISEFTGLLTTFLRTPGTPLDILTAREALAVERAIAKGRGTQESLVQLSELLNRYNKANKGIK